MIQCFYPSRVDVGAVCEMLVTDGHIRVGVTTRSCGSLDTDADVVQSIHVPAREVIQDGDTATNQDQNLHRLRDSLCILRQVQYRDWRAATRLLCANLLGDEKLSGEFGVEAPGSASYDHACLNWHTYVTCLPQLPEDIVDELRHFLTGNEFVTWSESLYLLCHKSGLESQVLVVTQLREWYRNLDTDNRPDLPIPSIVIDAHERLSEALERHPGNVLAHLLPLTRLGEFLNLGARSFTELEKGLGYKKVVAEGFLRGLGPRHRLTLQAERRMYSDYLWKGPYDYALEKLTTVYDLQGEVLGDDSLELLGTKSIIGGACHRLGRLQESKKIQREVLDRLCREGHDASKTYLVSELFLGLVHEIAGDVQDAAKLFGDVEKRWVDYNGKTNPLAAVLLTGLGSLFRRQSRFEDAEGYLLDAWSQRSRIQTTEHPMCVDSALQLAVLLRDSGQPARATEFLDQVSGSSVFASSFERVCQQTHIKACLAFDAGEYTAPRDTLLALIMHSTGVGRANNNREILWVRVNLADAMRSHDEADAALMLFTELVAPPRDDVGTEDAVNIHTRHDVQEPAHQLRIAETALRLVRDGRCDQATNLLRRENLAWVRTQDFWITFGGPMVDTATMHLRTPVAKEVKD